ncbi:efflux RND transporter permease subunit [Planctobacterium marinum]|uniref:efflux RND transporter permease subunit n=1 Tax=Planctobacterium marinum TaxID=1631968 RepID=UPI001E453FEE|nr:efflux RND transporter permease subunit [Planctobacterium marinum]MCC2605719.1 efflux RND transporter permease subunit [Planctobacterium marinum]
MLNFMTSFITHRTLVLSVILLILAGAVMAFQSLPVQQYPLINSVSIEIETYLSGAHADDVNTFVTKPLEQQLSSVDGVDYIDARSSDNLSKITLWLNLNVSAQDVIGDVNAKLTSARSVLPKNTEFPNVQVKRTDRPWATFYVSFASDVHSISYLTDEVDKNVRPLLASIPGVQRVSMEAPSYPAIRIYFDIDSLNDFGITPSEVVSQLSKNHSIASIGHFKTTIKDIFITSNSLNRTLEDFSKMRIDLNNGTSVPLNLLASLDFGQEKPMQKGFFSKDDAFYLGVWPAPGVNEIELGDSLEEKIEDIRTLLPEQTKMVLNYDATRYMREALSEVGKTLLETVFIVALVILVFLGKFRTVSIPVLTIPLSIALTLIVISLCGFSINLLTVLAIVLSIGLVVDDAIVMVEFIDRKVRSGTSPFEAAKLSIQTLTKPIVSMTLTMAVVFFPISLIDGISGALFFEFAITMSVLLLSSGIVCLFLTPYLSTRFVAQSTPNKLQLFTGRIEERLTRTYIKVLRRVLNVPLVPLLVVILALFFIYPLYNMAKQELAPTEDQGGIGLVFESYPDSSLEFTLKQSKASVEGPLSIDGVDYVWALISNTTGFGGLELLDWSDRELNAFEIYEQASKSLLGNEQIIAYPFLYPPLPGAGNFDVELVVKLNEDVEDLNAIAQKAVGAMNATGAFFFVDTNIKEDKPSIYLNVNWDEANRLGVTADLLNSELSVLFTEYRVARFPMQGRSYEVIPSISTSDAMTMDRLMGINVKSVRGKRIPLSEFATFEMRTSHREVSRFQQKNAIHLFGLKVPTETKESSLRKAIGALNEVLPLNSQIDFKGESRQIEQSETSIFYTITLALFLVFLVLSVQFNGFSIPAAILASTVPLSIFAALLFTAFDFTSINIYSQIGLLTLAGLITKNGILVAEYAEAAWQNKSNLVETTLIAASERFRPILMTSVATVFGHLPLVFVTGAGAEARNSIGIVLVAGMAIGSLVSLFVTPSIYLLTKRYLHSEQSKCSTLESGVTRV